MHKSLAIHDAYLRGDLEALKALLDDPVNFPNCQGPPGVGEIILEYAIYHSPLSFIRKLLVLGADPNYGAHGGFPSLIATLSTARSERYAILELLLSFGADIQQHGHNDYTPLHYAASLQDFQAMELLLAHGADLDARTHIDDYAIPLEEMEILGKKKAAAFLRKAGKKKRSRS
jgi:ankyrin repeat protein